MGSKFWSDLPCSLPCKGIWTHSDLSHSPPWNGIQTWSDLPCSPPWKGIQTCPDLPCSPPWKGIQTLSDLPCSPPWKGIQTRSDLPCSPHWRGIQTCPDLPCSPPWNGIQSWSDLPCSPLWNGIQSWSDLPCSLWLQCLPRVGRCVKRGNGFMFTRTWLTRTISGCWKAWPACLGCWMSSRSPPLPCPQSFHPGEWNQSGSFWSRSSQLFVFMRIAYPRCLNSAGST